MAQKALAYGANVDPGALCRIEAGTHALRVTMAIAWAHLLGVQPAEFVRAVLQDELTAAGVTLVVSVESDGQ